MQEKEYPVAFAETPTIECNIQKSFIEANTKGVSNTEIAPGIRLQIEANQGIYCSESRSQNTGIYKLKKLIYGYQSTATELQSPER